MLSIDGMRVAQPVKCTLGLPCAVPLAAESRRVPHTRKIRVARTSCRSNADLPGWDAAPSLDVVEGRVERYGSRATVSFESLHIRIPLKFYKILSEFSKTITIFRNSEKFRTSQHFLQCSAKFRE